MKTTGKCGKIVLMKKEKADNIISRLALAYPDAKPELEYSTPFELLVAVILSAQCTDKRVNVVTRKLFEVCDTPGKMLALSQTELEEYIRSCGLYRTKAAHILSACRDIEEKFGGKVPETREELTTLAGVGRKTANVVYSVAFGGEAIAVDTHVFRVSRRLGLSDADTPFGVEKSLNELIDGKMRAKAHHYLIFHGRRCCTARSPACEKCCVSDLCENPVMPSEKSEKK